MVIYEVNLDIDPDVYLAYREWLKDHIKKMLTMKGFQSAKILRPLHEFDPQQDQEMPTRLTILYTVDCLENLEQYFNEKAQFMRDEAKQLFPGKFRAQRRWFVQYFTRDALSNSAFMTSSDLLEGERS